MRQPSTAVGLLVWLVGIGHVAGVPGSEFVMLPGHDVLEVVKSPLPHTYVDAEADLPAHWNWANVNGTSFLTPMLNQHIPT